MTDTPPTKSEPGGWELMRAFERVEKRLDEAVKGFVSVVVHNLLADRVKEAEAEIERGKADAAAQIEKAKSEAAAQIAAIRTELDNAKKTRAQTWTAIGLLAAGGAITFVYELVTRGAGLS